MHEAPPAGSPLRVAVLGSGNGSNLQAILDRIRAGDVAAQVVRVVSDRPGARILERANQAGISASLIEPRPDEKRPAYEARLLAEVAGADWLVLAGYMRLVGKTLLTAYPNRILNIHPSLLPKHKGLRAVAQALAAGDTEAGCTTHIVTAELDGGPIVLQAGLRIRPGETEPELQKRILNLEHLILPRTLQLIAEGRLAILQGRVVIAPGASWMTRSDLPLVSGAWYSEGF